MNANGNGRSFSGTPLFKYARPTFNGFGIADEPDARVVQAIDGLVALMEKGYKEVPGSRQQEELKKLLKEKERLENEDHNGVNKAHRLVKKSIDEVQDAEKKLIMAESRLFKAQENVDQASRLLQQLLKQSEDTPPARNMSRRAGTKAANGAHADIMEANTDADEEIRKAKEALKDAQAELQNVSDDIKKARTALSEKLAQKQKEIAEYEHLTNMVRENLEETRDKIKALEETIKEEKGYEQMFSLENLDDTVAGKTKFRDKIGSDHRLNSAFLQVEDKISKTRLSFNASILLKEDVVLEFLFLRACLKDGLRDAQAISDRITDEEEGGVKYVYDYVVKEVMEQIIKDKKLKQ